ncbi:hypothetical protein GF327_09430 [Candidatus Woesearchaeota archaeon]|nr:hypothetical protein [Candidatus Woesearchaeota archaeon]
MADTIFPMVDERIEYEGLFSMKEVFRILDKYFRQKGYDKKIVFDEEYHTETGKYIHVKFTPYKKVDDYIRIMMRIWIYAHNLIEVEKELEGKKIKTNQGKLLMIFDSQMMTDYRESWSVSDPELGFKPIYFLIQVLMEKYIYRKRLAHWEGVIRHTLIGAKTEVASYLNLNKFLY